MRAKGVVGASGRRRVLFGPTEGLSYARSVYAEEVDWYKVADSKAQLLLTFNGAYITVLAGLLVLKPNEVTALKTNLTVLDLLFLSGTAAASAVSVLCAVACLRSRLSNANLVKNLSRMRLGDETCTTYIPAATFWFGTIAKIDQEAGKMLLRSANAAFEFDALVHEIFALAPNVLSKHRWVNRGWVSAAASLLFLLCSAAALLS
jgi:hypothetical protein